MDFSPTPPEVFHSACHNLRQAVHVVLVRPELGANVGAAARAMANMGILGSYRIVGDPSIVDTACRKLAKHAGGRVDAIQFFPSLEQALRFSGSERVLKLASTARSGSPHRPHPIRVSTALDRAIRKLKEDDTDQLVLVFGPEGDGLTNPEVDLCDWVVTIPSSAEYRSLNLAQAVLIFCYEVNRNFLEEESPYHLEEGARQASQKGRLITHLVRLAEEVGFILPGDPYKMTPRLEEIFDKLPNHIKDVKTLHGLIDQTIRSVRKGGPDLKGRFQHAINRSGVIYGDESNGKETGQERKR